MTLRVWEALTLTGVLGILAGLLWLVAGLPTYRLDPATPADSRTGQECRTYPAGLTGWDPQDIPAVVPTRAACWTPPQEASR